MTQNNNVIIHPFEEFSLVELWGGEMVPAAEIALKNVFGNRQGQVIFTFAEAGGAGEGEFESGTDGGLVPNFGVSGGGGCDLPVGDIAGAGIEPECMRW